MKLTEEEKRKFDKFVELKKVGDVCLACNFAFVDTTGAMRKVALITYSGDATDKSKPVTTHSNTIMPKISLRCNNCGFVQLFDSRIVFSLG
ncbi:MAG: hypothetical protein HeimC2_42490 [Candidatus Heimdallarchaeota archaeon LC_2]|nr:MAG: hypothetical protein HeimC2_42490 [Candidatus Heimdallarchaeota archaeon LC_2]